MFPNRRWFDCRHEACETCVWRDPIWPHRIVTLCSASSNSITKCNPTLCQHKLSFGLFPRWINLTIFLGNVLTTCKLSLKLYFTVVEYTSWLMFSLCFWKNTIYENYTTNIGCCQGMLRWKTNSALATQLWLRDAVIWNSGVESGLMEWDGQRGVQLSHSHIKTCITICKLIYCDF